MLLQRCTLAAHCTVAAYENCTIATRQVQHQRLGAVGMNSAPARGSEMYVLSALLRDMMALKRMCPIVMYKGKYPAGHPTFTL